MATVVTASNPGLVYDPRFKAAMNWVNAVQKDLDAQARDIGGPAPENKGNAIGSWKPVDKEIFNPQKYPRGFMPGGKLPFFQGAFGVRRIG
jgi:hypothetical protein